MEEQVLDGGDADLRQLLGALGTHALHELDRHAERLELRRDCRGAARIHGRGRPRTFRARPSERPEQLQHTADRVERRVALAPRHTVDENVDLAERVPRRAVGDRAPGTRDLLVDRAHRQRGARDLLRRAGEVLERWPEGADEILQRCHDDAPPLSARAIQRR